MKQLIQQMLSRRIFTENLRDRPGAPSIKQGSLQVLYLIFVWQGLVALYQPEEGSTNSLSWFTI